MNPMQRCLVLESRGERPSEGSHNEDVALGPNECDIAAERLLLLPVTTLSCGVALLIITDLIYND